MSDRFDRAERRMSEFDRINGRPKRREVLRDSYGRTRRNPREKSKAGECR